MADIQTLRQMAIDAELLRDSDVLPWPLQKFALAVEAAEREECAKACEARIETGAHLRCARDIRARTHKGANHG